MIINQYVSKNKNKTGIHRIYNTVIPQPIRKRIFEYRFRKKNYEPRAKKYFEKFENEEVFLFEAVFIETINRCNNVCPFCPVNKKQDTRELCEMSDELFQKIINELAEIGYDKKVAMYSNNEPFLDQKMIERCKYAREKLPNAYIYLYTNGILLTEKLYTDVMQFLDKMVIDNYNDELKLIKPVQRIQELCEENADYNNRTEIKLRKMNEVLSTRGGQSPNSSISKTVKTPCYLLFSQLVIRPDGGISLCCSDALGKYTLGDANKQPLVEIWKNNIYNELRKKMILEGRRGIDLCKYCDFMKGNS